MLYVSLPTTKHEYRAPVTSVHLGQRRGAPCRQRTRRAHRPTRCKPGYSPPSHPLPSAWARGSQYNPPPTRPRNPEMSERVFNGRGSVVPQGWRQGRQRSRPLLVCALHDQGLRGGSRLLRRGRNDFPRGLSDRDLIARFGKGSRRYAPP